MAERCSPSKCWEGSPARAIAARADGVDQGALFTGKQPTSDRESLRTFIGEEVAAVRWRQYRIYLTQFMDSAGNPSREEVNVIATSGWVIAQYLRLIGEYRKSLEEYPNPKAVELTQLVCDCRETHARSRGAARSVPRGSWRHCAGAIREILCQRSTVDPDSDTERRRGGRDEIHQGQGKREVSLFGVGLGINGLCAGPGCRHARL